MDAGQKYTEEVVKEIEKRLNAEYAAAEKEIQEKLDDYFRRYEIKDKKWQEWVEDGKKTEAEYKAWKTQQLAVGDKWQAQRDMIAQDLHHTNEIAKSITRSYMPQVYAENFNYATYDIEHGAKINTSFTLYSKESVERLVRDDPKLLPDPSKRTLKRIADNKDVVWNKQQLQSVMMQGILQGDSIPNLATRLAKTVGEKDRKAAVRNARTMAIATQNAGRRDAYKRAKDKGVDVEQMWLATMDNRTRHSHRWLDREVRPLGEAFSNGCEYPADPKGDPAEVYNCRCSLRGVVKGLERRSGKFRDDSAVGGMSYDEWRNAKPKYNPILLPEEKGEAIRRSYIREYGGYGNGTKAPQSTAPTYEKVTNRKEALASLGKVFSDIEGISRFDEQLLVDNTNRFNELNARYKAVKAEGKNYLHSTNSKAVAYTSGGYRDNSIELALSSKYYKNSEVMRETREKNNKSFWSMPCTEKDYNKYTITHEYGHIVEADISRKRTNFDDIHKKAQDLWSHNPRMIIREEHELISKEEKRQAKIIREEITDIAKKNNKDFDLEKNLSRYGCTNDYEFFAEVFANGHCGEPNELGKAILEWLEKEGY